MPRRIIWLLIGSPLALVAIAAGTAAAVPTLRHIASGLWNAPDHLPTLPDNRQVHYERGAHDYARVVSAMLPSVIARVEAVHGRAFAYRLRRQSLQDVNNATESKGAEPNLG